MTKKGIGKGKIEIAVDIIYDGAEVVGFVVQKGAIKIIPDASTNGKAEST